MFFRKKPNDGQTTWAVQRNKNSSLKKKRNELNFTERRYY